MFRPPYRPFVKVSIACLLLLSNMFGVYAQVPAQSPGLIPAQPGIILEQAPVFQLTPNAQPFSTPAYPNGLPVYNYPGAVPAYSYPTTPEVRWPEVVTAPIPAPLPEIPAPVKLYHDIWERVAENTFDPSKLGDWRQFEHKFDSQIKSAEDAVRYANMAISVAGDRYTYAVPPAQVQINNVAEKGAYGGAGISFDANAQLPTRQVNYPLDVNAQSQSLPPVKGFKITEVGTDGAAAAAGIIPGDMILRIDGAYVESMSAEQITRRIKGEANTVVNFTILRAGQVVEKPVTRRLIEVPILQSRMLADGIGYVYLFGFGQHNAADQFERALKSLSQAHALIIDMRNNGGGFTNQADAICSMLVENGVIRSEVQRVSGDMQHPIWERTCYELIGAEFVTTVTRDGKQMSQKRVARRAYLVDHRPLVLLVNGNTASAAEITTGCVQGNRAGTIVGTRTFGKGIGQSQFAMSMGAKLQVTSFKFFGPQDYWPGDAYANKIGYKPNVEVPPVAQLRLGSNNDNQLDVAYKQMRAQLDVVVAQRSQTGR